MEFTKEQIREYDSLKFTNPYIDNYSVNVKSYILDAIKKDYTSYVMDHDILFRCLSFMDDLCEYKIFLYLYQECNNVSSGLRHYIYVSSGELANMFGISKKRVKKILSKLYSHRLIDKWKDGRCYKLSVQYKINRWK